MILQDDLFYQIFHNKIVDAKSFFYWGMGGLMYGSCPNYCFIGIELPQRSLKCDNFASLEGLQPAQPPCILRHSTEVYASVNFLSFLEYMRLVNWLLGNSISFQTALTPISQIFLCFSSNCSPCLRTTTEKISACYNILFLRYCFLIHDRLRP